METINEESNLERNPNESPNTSPVLEKLLKREPAWGKGVTNTYLNQNNFLWCKKYFPEIENELLSMKIIRQIILNQVMFFAAEYRVLYEVITIFYLSI